jgi:putative ABC transport system permease protein
MLQDIRVAARRLASQPTYTALMVLILTLGIGANTAIFTIVDQTVLRLPPYRHADRLVQVIHVDRPGGGGGNSLSPEKIAGWQSQPSVFERLEAYAPQQLEIFGDGEPERIVGVLVSTDLFEMLGVAPQRGRRFRRPDGQPGSQLVTILSDGLWRRRFGADPEAIGRTINLNGELHTIVGVMPRRFQLLGGNERLFVPIDVTSPGAPVLRSFMGLGWLPAGVTIDAAQARADVAATGLLNADPLTQGWHIRLMPHVIAFMDDTARKALLILFGAGALVLLISCVNVASLFLVRASGREREISLRAALGASRPRLIREVLVESVLLSMLGGAFGLVGALWAIDAVLAAAPASMRFLTETAIAIDMRVFAVTGAITLTTGVLLGLVPAIRGSGVALERGLRDGSQGTAGRAGTGHLSGVLVVTEMAVALILLVGAALMMRTFVRLNAIDPGFEPRNLLTMQIALPNDRYPTEAARSAFFDDLTRRLEETAGIEDIGVARGMIPGGSGITFGLRVDNGATVAEEVALNDVTSGFFPTLRIPIVEGRVFDPGERDVAVVSRSLARRISPDDSALGRRVRIGSAMTWQTVVGVAGDVENRIIARRLPMSLYLPFADWAPVGATRPPIRRAFVPRSLIVRSANAPDVLPLIKQQVWALDSRQPIEQVALAADLYAGMFDRERFVLLMMTVFSIVALLLAAAGIFAVLSQVVAQRTREIGLRVALGATSGDIFRTVGGRGLALAVFGTAAGLAGAGALSRVMTALLFEVSPYDLFSYASVAVVLMAVALLACWLPTRRAMRIEPAVALRTD